MQDTAEKQSPNYYAIIPANVRYDNELRANEKLLYGEISALANRTGECWATNRYFADLYGVSTESVRQWLRNLERRGYIRTRIEYEGKEVKARYISIIDAVPSPEQKQKQEKEKPEEDRKQIEAVVEYLNERTGKRYRSKSVQAKHIFARLSEGYSVDDCKTVIDNKTEEWLGTDMEKYLRIETLFGSKFDGYLNQQVKRTGGIGKICR